MIDVKRTYEEIVPNHTKKIWIAQPGSGLDKRQCTLPVMTRADGEQPRIAIMGTRIGDDEKNAWHQEVDVYWQTNAWADTEVSTKWSKESLAKSVDGL